MANQMKKKNKRPNKYEVGDLLRISIPKIDRSGTDQNLELLIYYYSPGERGSMEISKMNPIENRRNLWKRVNGDKYQVEQFKIIETLGTMFFHELNNLPSNKISVRKGTTCNCKVNVIV
ncbi:hypothetical protein GLOIN_2v1782991 [Rhizophagus irregularis DAOM 181602=DAOM 197198]|uniref:Uncharacterized protein n=1 Tax=Rhizophagus irregularis (strain DAOM 181602 / DAOM 197198 / MUCL 43194) TaxID=747089 RepID=U9THU7_RHIID|nr:hypothetical protein GLOIN_2v1782991 [Rhizophagus irregularis DAOM 181602=DAOM 197198]POG64395.1 hypothetical protein GLOIN_2v1782991 [Rhizophagus irregularis DAOM 181602=DAOM 197198]GBC19354.1 hypothetical protein GLOIN_2v1782991 [Rhizophagus irregularis DAOM 181602=DAOM 197198]|eukprot:XP_025171261.1 hypothetical protein GLOIN_2v1782991 [Rhizophagus irregularis DAOM 181602=DAOM 197198]